MAGSNHEPTEKPNNDNLSSDHLVPGESGNITLHHGTASYNVHAEVIAISEVLKEKLRVMKRDEHGKGEVTISAGIEASTVATIVQFMYDQHNFDDATHLKSKFAETRQFFTEFVDLYLAAENLDIWDLKLALEAALEQVSTLDISTDNFIQALKKLYEARSGEDLKSDNVAQGLRGLAIQSMDKLEKDAAFNALLDSTPQLARDLLSHLGRHYECFECKECRAKFVVDSESLQKQGNNIRCVGCGM